jgi:hypothetical protein
MWQRCMTRHAVAATKVAISFSRYYRNWDIHILSFYVFNSEKSLMVVSQVEGSYYRVKRGSP